ncbi:hypothetical protein ACXYMX_06185 [Sporosarcina sp. CAU 1771]
MDFPLVLIVIGLVAIVASFFLGNSSSNYSDELEKVSMSLHQETSGLKKRLRAVEEELMIGVGPVNTKIQKKSSIKPIHEIIVNQILSLQAQDFSVEDIAKRSSLSKEEVLSVLREKGEI